MKKNKFVCVSVTGQRSKVKKTSMIGKMLLLSSSRPLRFRWAGNSTNQLSRGCEFSQSSFEGLEIQPIRF
jgi:hypothetical protein